MFTLVFLLCSTGLHAGELILPKPPKETPNVLLPRNIVYVTAKSPLDLDIVMNKTVSTSVFYTMKALDGDRRFELDPHGNLVITDQRITSTDLVKNMR